MQVADAATTARAPENTPAMIKKIGKTTYKVHVHFHYFVDDCPLCTPMASTEAVAANRYDHSFLSGTVLHALRVYFIYIADLIRLEF